MEELRQIASVIGEIVAYTGAVGLATYGIFRFLGTKWLENKFAESLETFKHRQNQELQRLKLQIDTLLDRTVKLHQREFEVLPQIWSLLVDAFMAVRGIAIGFQQYPNIDSMPHDQFEEWLAKSEMAEWQKNEIRRSDDKNHYYSQALARRQWWDAEKKRQEFTHYLAKNSVFLPPALREEMDRLNVLMVGATVEREINMQDRAAPALREGTQEFNTSGTAIFKALETAIHDRLWSSTKATNATD